VVVIEKLKLDALKYFEKHTGLCTFKIKRKYTWVCNRIKNYSCNKTGDFGTRKTEVGGGGGGVL